MTVKKISYDALVIAVKMLGYTQEARPAVINLRDGSRMTTTTNIFTTPEGQVLVNPDRTTTTYVFDTKEEFANQTKFEFFNTDKEMYQTFTGMDDETWEEWNK